MEEALSSFDFKEVAASLSDAIAPTLTQHQSSGFSPHDLLTELFERMKTLPKAEVTNIFFRAIAVALLRGNIRKDKLERTSDTGKATIKRVAATLGIEIRDKCQKKLVLTNKTLTFSRMIALFPHLAFFPAQTHKLPIAMLHSGFAGLIPRESDDIEIIDLICICHSAFHALYKNQKRYTEAARKFGLIPDEDRIGFNFEWKASVTRSSFTIVEDRVKIVKDDAKWQELLKKTKSIVDASSSMRSQVAAVDSLDGV
ncbi:predicted protein [Arabidopsis lyrata subsp. lyrata]|uniref:Predicted protein n=1 Tax=Arabidopsis lyrata subsp. lyrata TaxID=81972 RepID=D7LYZ4_ARALL|nr:predicted protein [Arabidopsis lyrata subsp. lyrata]